MLKIKPSYYPLFDWLRGLLALTVMFYHEGLIGWEPSGDFAVQIFFALSGWLIGGILIKLEPTELTRFYFNRAIRIWTPYFFALILLITASLIRESITGKWIEFIFYKISFVYNIFGAPQRINYFDTMPLDGTGNYFWTVNAEEQFYLLAPFLLLVNRNTITRSTIFWIVLAVLANILDIYASIVFGVLAAVAVNEYGKFYEKNWVKTLLIFILMLSVFTFTSTSTYSHTSPFAAVSIILLLAVKGQKTKLGSMVGGMSYPLYLNHWVGLFVAHACLKPFGLRDSFYANIMSLCLNVSLAIALYWFMDKKLLAIRNNLYTEKLGKIFTFLAFSTVIIGVIVGLMIKSTRY